MTPGPRLSNGGLTIVFKDLGAVVPSDFEADEALVQVVGLGQDGWRMGVHTVALHGDAVCVDERHTFQIRSPQDGLAQMHRRVRELVTGDGSGEVLPLGHPTLANSPTKKQLAPAPTQYFWMDNLL
jgi:hypothetical protein